MGINPMREFSLSNFDFLVGAIKFNAHQKELPVMKTYSFEKQEVWILAKKLTVFVYSITKPFPKDERFGLISQMRRAAISVCSNFAEGNAKKSGKEKARYTETSYCSLMELLNQGIISHELNYLDDNAIKKMREMIDEISNKTSKLKEYQLSLP